MQIKWGLLPARGGENSQCHSEDRPSSLGRDFGPCRINPVPSLAAPPSGSFLAGKKKSIISEASKPVEAKADTLWGCSGEESRVDLFVTFLDFSATIWIKGKKLQRGF